MWNNTIVRHQIHKDVRNTFSDVKCLIFGRFSMDTVAISSLISSIRPSFVNIDEHFSSIQSSGIATPGYDWARSDLKILYMFIQYYYGYEHNVLRMRMHLMNKCMAAHCFMMAESTSPPRKQPKISDCFSPTSNKGTSTDLNDSTISAFVREYTGSTVKF